VLGAYIEVDLELPAGATVHSPLVLSVSTMRSNGQSTPATVLATVDTLAAPGWLRRRVLAQAQARTFFLSLVLTLDGAAPESAPASVRLLHTLVYEQFAANGCYGGTTANTRRGISYRGRLKSTTLGSACQVRGTGERGHHSGEVCPVGLVSSWRL
jgi:hypothetical protein